MTANLRSRQYTVLNARDHLLLPTSNQDRTATERRLRAISRAGRLAGWHGERGNPDAAKTPLTIGGKELYSLDVVECGGSPHELPPRLRVAWFPRESGQDNARTRPDDRRIPSRSVFHAPADPARPALTNRVAHQRLAVQEASVSSTAERTVTPLYAARRRAFRASPSRGTA